jgi:hypothetical protein
VGSSPTRPTCTGEPFTEHRNIPDLRPGPADPRLEWQQAADRVRAAIRSGQLASGDTLPSVPDLSSGEVAVRGGEHVHATDGNIGEIQGLVIDSGSHQVTHVLLEEGHVFGRKVVAIPIGAVTGVNQDGIQLNVTKQQVKDLPAGCHRSPG